VLNNSRCFIKQVAPFAIQAGALSGHTQVLARRAKGDHIGAGEGVGVKRGHVIMRGGVGEFPGQKLAALGIDFARPKRFKTGPLKAKVKAANARE